MITVFLILGIVTGTFAFYDHVAFAGEAVKEKGDRILGIAVNVAKNKKFGSALNTARDAGLEFVTISAHWNEVETAKGEYQTRYYVQANKLYSSQNIKIALTINPINTNNLTVPEYLRNRSFDDPEFIKAFLGVIDFVLPLFEDCDIQWISIGNEVGGYLENDRRKWEAYRTLYRAAREHIKRKNPEIPVGVKVMYQSLSGKLKGFVQELNEETDLVLLTYYHLKFGQGVLPPHEIHDVFDEVVQLYPDRIIHFAEIGYPTSKFLGGSNKGQSRFIEESFKAWDRHADQVKLLYFFMLHDLTKKQLKGYLKYYGIQGRAFAEYLGTLGLRSVRGKDKGALETLKKQAKARGW